MVVTDPARPAQPLPPGTTARPAPLSTTVRDQFRRQRTRDTGPELALRSALHRLGLRFRVDRSVLPGRRFRADVVFGPARVAVFVDGCFWHSCPVHGNRPRNNAEWWAVKLDANVERDRSTDSLLTAEGWLPLRVWEHEDPAAAAARVGAAVRSRRSPGAPDRGQEHSAGEVDQRPR